MPIPLQAVALLGAGYVLWRLWRVSEQAPPLLRYLIAGGFLIRAFAAQFLFWVSWLELPFGRSLQLGNGLWFFGLDALSYFGPAVHAAENGLVAILKVRASLPSVVFVRVLALFAWLFGSVVSVAILLNVAVYLGMSLLIVRWAARHNVPVAVTAIPIFAVGYLPSWILWALQPLKDAFFCFLIILFAFAVDRFVAAWKRPPGARAGAIAGAAMLVLLATHLLSGVRWYYAAMALGTAALVCLSILFVRRGGRELAVRAGVLALLGIASAQIFVTSAGPYVPAPILAVVRPWVTRRHNAVTGVRGVVGVVEESRRNIDRYTSAGTTIRSGRRLETNEQPATKSAATSAPSVRSTTALPAKTTDTRTASSQPAQATPPPAKKAVDAATIAPPKKTTPPSAKKAADVTTIAPPPKTTPPARPTASKRAEAAPPQSAKKEPVPNPVSVTPPPPTAVVAPPAKTPPAANEAAKKEPELSVGSVGSSLPQTPKQRLLAGVAALLLPRSIAVKLELVSIGGGRGMWWFAELDTILVDLVLLIVLALVVASLRRGTWRDPFVWYLLVMSGGIAGALAYTISNYGTLLRHRGMIMATVVLLALAVRRCAAGERAEAEGEVAVPEFVARPSERSQP